MFFSSSAAAIATLLMILSNTFSRSGALLRMKRWVSSSKSASSTALDVFDGYQQPDTKFDAFEQAQKLGNNPPCIILVNPYLDQNVGSVARCMLNFGLTELRIVSPKCELDTEPVKALSAGAYKIVEQSKVYSDLSECLKDFSRVMATTNRPRHMTQLVYTPYKAAEEAFKLDTNEGRVAIMFGRERYGLFNEEIALADSVITIPTFNHFSSLNLAQAVNLVSYELWNRRNMLSYTAPPDAWLQPKDKDRLARRDDLEQYFKRLEQQLDIRVHQPDAERRVQLYRSVRNIFQRTLLSKTEVDILQGLLTTLIRPAPVESTVVTAKSVTENTETDISPLL